ncbi:MAG: M14 family metallopeptidase [Candidatus Thermoplasmatota archaeon]|nr:M14 family metallopeptidase [Candidatus Thermoplasmatota archaeon]
MRVAVGLVLCLLLAGLPPVATASSDADDAWPGEPVDNHVHMTWAALTMEVNDWADNHPDIVKLIDAGDSELGKTLWVLQISDWSMETKANGKAKEIVYIDGGHHGNEYLGTALAWLSAQFYIEGWSEGNQEVIDVLQSTELHILIMLNPDGNDFDTRWNINQVDLNRNYDHYWNTCPTTQPGSSAFSEAETAANAEYMNTYVTDADLYVTMHTGVWIILYPWGKWADQPSDWELFHRIRDDVNANISDIPMQNANQGLYPNCGTSRDYGYGVMGIPTFTFETDDEQFVPGSVEALNERLDEELDVMRYLISNVWYWRARLDVHSIQVSDEEVVLDVSNLGQASTSNATLQFVDSSGQVSWTSSLFTVNATNSTVAVIDASNLTYTKDGSWQLYYQKRVIDAAKWVTEPLEINATVLSVEDDSSFLIGYGLFSPTTILAGLAVIALLRNEDEESA